MHMLGFAAKGVEVVARSFVTKDVPPVSIWDEGDCIFAG